MAIKEGKLKGCNEEKIEVTKVEEDNRKKMANYLVFNVYKEDTNGF